MFAFFKKKEDDATEDTAAHAAMEKELHKEQQERAARKGKKMEEQGHVIAMLDQLPPEVKTALSNDIDLAKSALQSGQPVPASLMQKLIDANKAMERENIKKTLLGCGTAVAHLSAASLFTPGLTHGLHSLTGIRTLGMGVMAA